MRLLSRLVESFRDCLNSLLCDCAIIMQKINLIYNINYQLIVCIEYDYCVLISSLEHHLRFKHELKDDRLHATLAKTNTLKIKKFEQAQASIDVFAISHLAIEFEF